MKHMWSNFYKNVKGIEGMLRIVVEDINEMPMIVPHTRAVPDQRSLWSTKTMLRAVIGRLKGGVACR